MREHRDKVHLHNLNVADLGAALFFRKQFGRGDTPIIGIVPHPKCSPFALDYEKDNELPVFFWTKDGKRIADGFTMAGLLPHGWLIVWFPPDGDTIDAFSVPYWSPSRLISELEKAGCKVNDPAACIELLETLRPRITLSTERLKKSSRKCVRA